MTVVKQTVWDDRFRLVAGGYLCLALIDGNTITGQDMFVRVKCSVP